MRATKRTARRAAVGHQEQTVAIPMPERRLAPPPGRRDLRPPGAVVYLPPGTEGAGRWMDLCGQYIQRRGYQLTAVCTAWRDVIGMVMSGAAQVIVVGRWEHLEPDRTPRVDVVTGEASEAERHRRPRRRSRRL